MSTRVELITWNDLIEHVTDFMGAQPSGEARRDAKRATLHGLRDIANCYNWAYYYSRGRINMNEPYSTGTVEYDHTGGAHERMLTLTDGTWPTWAALGYVNINDVVYEIATRQSSSIITLSVNSNPGEDVASGTSYTLFRDEYPLPCNFQSMGEVIIATFSRVLAFEHPNDWLARQRIWRGTACPHSYSIKGNPDYQNTLSMAVYPPPDDTYVIDYLYKRRPRPLKYDSYSTGTVSVSSGATAVVGSGTAFESGMVGSILRLGSTTQVPTSRWGSYPFSQERVITAVGSATACTVDAAWSASASAVKQMVSDPIDIDVGSMLTFLLRRSELNTGYARSRKDRGMLEQMCMQEEIRAREADSRNFKEEAMGRSGVWPTRLADFPFLGNG